MAKIWQQNAHHSSEYEMEQRVEFTVKLIRQMTYKSEIKRALKDQYGIEFRECDRYIARARARILSDSTENTRQTGAVLQDKLSEIIGSDTTVANKIRAIEVFAKILGLNMLNINQTVNVSSGELDVRRQRIAEALTVLQQQQLLSDSSEAASEN